MKPGGGYLPGQLLYGDQPARSGKERFGQNRLSCLIADFQ
jgi:hypothetical protein